MHRLQELSKTECVAMLQLMHHCANAQGGPGVVDAVFGQLGRLLPMTAAVIASGRIEHGRVRSVDRLFSHGANPWLGRYRENGLERVDPIVRRALEGGGPFRWSQALASHPTADRAYRELKGDVGDREGIAVACMNPRHGGRASLLSIAMPERSAARRHLLIAGHVLPHIHEMLAESGPADASLTPRELEVLRWVADGKSNWETAAILSLSERTVKFHLANAFGKLGVHTRAQAIAKALRRGWLFR